MPTREIGQKRCAGSLLVAVLVSSHLSPKAGLDLAIENIAELGNNEPVSLE